MADIIFDVDGTLMNVEHRRHHVEKSPGKKRDFNAFRQATVDDTPHDDIVDMAKMLKNAGHTIIISTGRLESEKSITIKQLKDAGVAYDALYMRPTNLQSVPDYEIKEAMLEQMRKDGYKPTMAFDDRRAVVDMWRRNGLRVLQVAPGDF